MIVTTSVRILYYHPWNYITLIYSKMCDNLKFKFSTNFSLKVVHKVFSWCTNVFFEEKKQKFISKNGAFIIKFTTLSLNKTRIPFNVCELHTLFQSFIVVLGVVSTCFRTCDHFATTLSEKFC